MARWGPPSLPALIDVTCLKAHWYKGLSRNEHCNLVSSPPTESAAKPRDHGFILGQALK